MNSTPAELDTELALRDGFWTVQIHKETRKFSKPYNLRVCAAFGGLSKYEQFKDLKAGSEVPLAHAAGPVFKKNNN